MTSVGGTGRISHKPRVEGLGRRIREAAGRRGLANTESLGKKLGVQETAVRKWFEGESEPSLFYVAELARVLACTTDELLGVK